MHSYTKYFKSDIAYDRFISMLYSKYRSLGKFSGNIKLDNLSDREAIVLSRFFDTYYKKGDSIIISINKFISIMNNSRYDDFDIEILVSEYLDVELVTNKEKNDIFKNEEDVFYRGIIIDINSIGDRWLLDIVNERKKPYNLIHKRYNNNKVSLKKELINIIKLINNLPRNRTLLSIYSSLHTGDPHYLDLDNNHSILFFYALSYVDKSDFPISREDKIRLLTKYNIDIDNISNYVITYGLLSDRKEINMFGWHKEALILNIQNIINTEWLNTEKGRVFVFENPSLLNEMMINEINESIIISGGFPNISVYLLIDKLISKGNKIYYNGDFDPEGLIIADNFKKRYGDNLILFCYDDIDYKNCISKKEISDKRISKLSKVSSCELVVIKRLLLNCKMAGYQENNKERIIDFIKRYY